MPSEPTDFLYPFLDARPHDSSSLTADLAASAQAKMAESRTLRTLTLERCAAVVTEAGLAMAERLRRGGRVLCFGNGGSSTDAEGMAALFRRPPGGRPLAAMSLVDDTAVLTALANDVGFELAFSRQIIAYGRPMDVAVGFSTSGDSVNVLRALQEAHERQLLTIGFCGYGGGAMAASEVVDHCLVVRSESVHRIQEAQAALTLRLWTAVQQFIDEGVGR